MGASNSPPKTVVQSVTEVGMRVLRSVKLVGPEKPTGVSWKCKDPRKAYKFGAELGHGTYGVVHLVTHARSGRIFACKILRNGPSKLHQQHLLAEVEALHRVDSHKNIATLHEVWDHSGYLYLIMEACLGGELFEVIMHRGHFSEKDAAVVARVILDVVSHCHRLGVAHRDLKPENFLLKRKALDPKQPLRADDLRLVDFGLAISLSSGEAVHELLGSPFYIAPEILRGSYGFAADLWSVGVILYILLCGLPPFPGNNERQIFQRILRLPLDLSSEPWNRISANAKDLVARLLERDPQKRITPADGLRHAWLTSAASASSAQSQMFIERLRSFAEMSKLQGLLMNVIAKNMSTEGIGALQDVFDSLDTNHDGYLSFEELRQGMEDASGESEACSRAAQAVMAALDVSGDGFIEYHEFLAAVLDRQQTLTDQTIAEMFALLDKNKDGKLSPAELRTALAESGIDISEASLEELMRDMPGVKSMCHTNEEPELTMESFSALLRGSLQNEEVMLSQLAGAVSDMQQSFRMRNRFKQLAMLVIARTTPVSELQGLRELFQQLDIDNSGLLSLDELRRGLRVMDSELGDDDIEELLRFMDVDGNQMVDYHEFVMGTLEDKQLLTEAKLRAAFDYFDSDRNGYIDIGEVEKVVSDLGIRMMQSPRDLVSGADANEDEVVDFEEFRDMMLTAEPNVLTSQQNSFVSPHSTSEGSDTDSRRNPTTAASSGHHQLGFSKSSLEARYAAMPKDALCPAVREDLCGGDSAAGALKEELQGQSRAYQDRVRQFLAMESSNCDGQAKAGSSLKRPETEGTSGREKRWPPRDHAGACSAPAAERLPMKASKSLHRRAGSESQQATPRRRRHLVYINSEHGQGFKALEGETDPMDVDVSCNAANGRRAPEAAEVLVSTETKAKMPPSPFTSGRAAAEPHSKATQQQGHPREHLLARAIGADDALRTLQPDPQGQVALRAMLNFMDDQWSKTSVLAFGKN